MGEGPHITVRIHDPSVSMSSKLDVGLSLFNQDPGREWPGIVPVGPAIRNITLKFCAVDPGGLNSRS